MRGCQSSPRALVRWVGDGFFSRYEFAVSTVDDMIVTVESTSERSTVAASGQECVADRRG